MMHNEWLVKENRLLERLRQVNQEYKDKDNNKKSGFAGRVRRAGSLLGLGKNPRNAHTSTTHLQDTSKN
jgi:hypothetical protein